MYAVRQNHVTTSHYIVTSRSRGTCKPEYRYRSRDTCNTHLSTVTGHMTRANLSTVAEGSYDNLNFGGSIGTELSVLDDVFKSIFY